jgi:hypothetical protein
MLLLIFSVPLLLSCASASRNDEVYSDQMNTNMDLYMDCMKKATSLYLAAEASPYEVADAVQSRCSSEFHAFEGSAELYLTSSRTTKRGVLLAQQGARDLAQEVKGAARAKVVQWVIEGRAQKE